MSATRDAAFARRLGAIPLLWMLAFLLLPLLLIGKVSLAESALAQPPFTDLFGRDGDGGLVWQGSLQAFALVLDDPWYREGLLGALRMASLTTLACLALGLPMAWCIARAPTAWRTPLLLLVILPFWTSFLIRVYAWMGLLKPTGPVSALLQDLGWIEAPLALLHTDTAVLLGMSYAYLPFMVLPLYATFARLDGAVLEAAADLGAGPLRTFVSVALPMARSGVAAGCLLVFIPAVG
ncbi:MAG TPA: putrescine ABC transporter permease PotH, partial [Pseudomonadales bacterium]|nr:putrescine ABC transporter permease PotH [Pseudomonadales bacterium]